MKKSIITLLIAVIIVLSFPYCNRHQLEMLKEDPIITIGHGAFIGQDGKPLEINEKFLEQMQDYYIAYLGSEKAASFTKRLMIKFWPMPFTWIG
jgi:hypothetical protein